jgi:hypothetical protein
MNTEMSLQVSQKANKLGIVQGDQNLSVHLMIVVKKSMQKYAKQFQ